MTVYGNQRIQNTQDKREIIACFILLSCGSHDWIAFIAILYHRDLQKIVNVAYLLTAKSTNS